MIRIDRLPPADADEVARILDEPGDEEGRFFDGLPADAAALQEILQAADRDGYWAIRVGDRLGGLFMLRGFDAGYAIPSFGVVIARAFRGVGLGRLALQYAESWCRLEGVEALMLTVAPENRRALALYEARGFRPDGSRSPKGNPIYRKALSR